VNFANLDPVEQRLRVVESFLAELPAPEGSPRLTPATRTALARAKRALVEGLEGEEREYELKVWHDHLDKLDAHDSDAAIWELSKFSRILHGLRRPEEEDER
jgi:hypothetical protein